MCRRNYFTSCDPQHDIYTCSYWHIFWHSIWHIFWHSIWHSIWHIFWHSIWQIFWHSIWHIFWHSIWHIFWHSIWHSIWNRQAAESHGCWHEGRSDRQLWSQLQHSCAVHIESRRLHAPWRASHHAGRVLKVVKKCRCCLWFESKHLKIKS